MGITWVAFLAATEGGVPSVTITSTLSRTNSSARRDSLSGLPSAHRYSITRFRPSIHPRARRPSTNAARNRTFPVTVVFERYPIRRTSLADWASAIGAPASKVSTTMRPRALIGIARAVRPWLFIIVSARACLPNAWLSGRRSRSAPVGG